MKPKYLILVFLAGLFISTRLINLMKFPVFMDEALYIRWLTTIKSTGNWLLPLQEFGWEPLSIWLSTLLDYLINNSLLSLRLTAGFFGLLSCLFLYLITKSLVKPKTAQVILFTYLVSPMILLHDRLGLRGDSAISFCLSLTLYGLYLRLIKNQSRASFLISLAIIIGLLTKTTVISIPVIVVLSFIAFKKKPSKIDLLAILLIFIPVIFYSLSNTLALVATKASVFSSSQIQLIQIKNNLFQLFPWLIQYLTWPVFLLFILGLFISFHQQKPLFKLFSISFITPFLITLVTAKILFPRYILLSFLSALVFAGYSLAIIVNRLPKLIQPLSIAFLIPSLVISFNLLTDLKKANLPAIEKWQYVTGWPAGFALPDLIEYLKINPPDVLITEENNLIRGGLLYYWQDYPFKLIVMSEDNIINDNLQPNQLTYLSLNVLEKPPKKINAELIKTFPRPENKSSIKLYKINPE